MRVTLPRALSKLGHCSRTQAERLIAEGRVKLNGRRAMDPSIWVDLISDLIAVDGQTVSASAKLYIMMNKPRGVVTTRDDPDGRATVFDCLKLQDMPFVSPVGRLDKASEGLLLFTNDTVLAQRLLDPVTNVPKIYHVQVGGEIGTPELEQMIFGIPSDGELLRATSVDLLRRGSKHAWIEVELREGRYRQIRRMLEGVGLDCLRLVRIAVDTLRLGDLQKGDSRSLTTSEIASLRKRAGLE
ncbi:MULTISPECIES: pseudouridine synthase [Agrobacterium]|uniref:Pseudouridine synthase n=1 Tax=Agrobacterium salinitolerans TaxID=1183413 RepID=A0A9X3KUI1_9HYPH|nr:MULTISPECIES: pseudouridine synthase [Agrobacterium]MCZ7854900.1 pseudouridine synthase [Agrobacterium salinitolerans]MCZ7859590.1 pseudouridine synthase [Agrobacterium salinitolerans]MCZ7889764.1 pseudouridine synthase [Agrobacterium salinitolerans]MCZ7894643.1 pseudouridine synthase [Agrobacterium salinitolerans]MCZ7940543.1 pseudouridine synthase [Agrobacterium salinitolerans]